nr:UPF0175 family protein [Candidatus Sigynarchaeota archaeon]
MKKRGTGKSERITIVIPPDLKGELEMLLKVTQLDKSSLIRQLLRKSIREIRIEQAIKAYEDGKVSFGKASEIACLNLWDWIDEVHRRGVHWRFSVTDAQQELETLRNRK